MPRALIAMLMALAACTASQTTPEPRSTSCAIKVAGDTTVYTTADLTEKPILRSHPPLEYPRTALRDGVTGLVALSVIINADGSTDPTSIRVTSSVRVDVDSAAIRWLFRSSYWPGCRGTEAVRVRTDQLVSFSIVRGQD